eukprot:TRINITY_DN5365_c0_g1_i1.p1 TRINITY_DN5365_c0_g1~~TRINITY_DN5365_c0_g1_i1.p1  ORF type:complete len:246 (+),score=24.45 TRINITY_DN5365_c0_g1_i1:25-762(+)
MVAHIIFYFLPKTPAEEEEKEKLIDIVSLNKDAIEEVTPTTVTTVTVITEKEEVKTSNDEARRLARWILMMVFIGCIRSYFFGYVFEVVKALHPSLSDPEIKGKISIYHMVEGLLQTLSGIAIGPIIDRFGVYFSLNLCVVTIFSAFFCTFTAMLQSQFWILIIAAGAWGWSENSLSVTIGSMIKKEFNGRLEIYSIYRGISFSSMSFGILFQIFIKDYPTIVYLGSLQALFAFALIMFILLRTK